MELHDSVDHIDQMIVELFDEGDLTIKPVFNKHANVVGLIAVMPDGEEVKQGDDSDDPDALMLEVKQYIIDHLDQFTS